MNGDPVGVIACLNMSWIMYKLSCRPLSGIKEYYHLLSCI